MDKMKNKVSSVSNKITDVGNKVSSVSNKITDVGNKITDMSNKLITINVAKDKNVTKETFETMMNEMKPIQTIPMISKLPMKSNDVFRGFSNATNNQTQTAGRNKRKYKSIKNKNKKKNKTRRNTVTNRRKTNKRRK